MRKIHGPLLFVLITAAHLLVIGTIAHSVLNGRMDQWADRKAVLDRAELWSVEVLPTRREWPPVKLCADARARSGFLQPMPTVDGAPCVADERPQRRGASVSYRCTVNGAQFANSASFEGDPNVDFKTTYRITRLGRGPSYQQARRYRRLGDCPVGWRVGDHTDRAGRRVGGAIYELAPS